MCELDFIDITKENIETEHLCCAIGDKKHQLGVQTKKDWISLRLDKGHVFRKLNAQGKVFIEYEPLENALVPINGINQIYIYCLWVSGSFSGHGYATKLLQSCIDEAKKNGKDGICMLSSKKKKSFLCDKAF